MAKSSKNEIKNMAKLAKQRLRTGFWEECKESVNESVNKAKADGENSSNVIRYYKTRVTRVISGCNEQKEAFYLKVKNILDTYGDVSDIIGRLCDLEYMKTLNFQQREKYLSEIAAQYRECRERYDQEKRFDLSQRIS
jgi:hypothetical protein